MKPHSRLLLAWIALASVPSTLAEVVINELMIHPAAVDGTEPLTQEFIELWNRGDRPVDLTNWQFDRGVQYTFPPFVLPAGGFAVIAADPSGPPNLPPGFSALGPWEGRLSNSGESVRLVDSAGDTVDRVRYADEGDWAMRRQVTISGQLGWEWVAPFDGQGQSLELVNPNLPNEHGQNWRSSPAIGGTPGLANGNFTTTSAPLISSVRHHPAVPTAVERVTVRAQITAPAGTNPKVELYYRLSTTDPGEFRRVAMLPDDSGLHAARITPHPNGSVIEFFVRAEADNDAVRTWPPPSDETGTQGANALYQVDDEVVSSHQPYYRVVMTVEEDLRFRPESFPARSNAQMNASFIVSRDGETTIRYQAGLRRRGNGSRSRNPRSFRLNLPADTPWRSTSQLNLVAQYTYLQVLGLHLFKAAGLPAPEAIFVQLRLNGVNYAHSDNRYGVHYGSYAHIQPLNGEFIEKTIPQDADGDLYKKVSADPSRDRKRWGVHFEDEIVYNTPQWYVTDRWTKETHSAANDWSRFQDFIVTMNEAPADRYFDEVSRRVDVEQWVRWFALMCLINNRETSLSNGIDDDYSIYQGTVDPRVRLLPHDLDTIFGLGDTPTTADATIFQMTDERFGNGAARMPQLEPFFSHPDIRPAYFQALHDLMETVLEPASFEPFLDSLLVHVPARERDRIKQFNRDRHEHVRTIIDAPLTIEPIDAPQINGLYITDATEITLRGSVSPRLTTRVLLNSEEAALDRGRGTWQLDGYGLAPGINLISVQALDAAGHPLDSASLRVQVPNTDLQEISGTLVGDVVLPRAGGPYLVRDAFNVPTGRTLTLEPGTVLLFAAEATLRVDGRLVAEGTEKDPILFSAGHGSRWSGVTLEHGSESRLRHVTWNNVSPTNSPLSLVNAHLTGSDLNFSSHEGVCISLQGASITLEDSLFPQEEETTSLLSSGGLLSGFPLRLQRNQLGSVRILERPAGDDEPIVMMQNHFGGGGTAIEMEGSARVVGNRFESMATAIHLGHGSLLLANSAFHQVGEILRYSASAEATLEHLFTSGVGNLLTGPPSATLRAYIANSVLVSVENALPEELETDSLVQFTHNLVSPGLAEALTERSAVLSEALTAASESLVMTNDDDTLAPGSLGKGAGTHGQDLGLIDPQIPFIRGRPAGRTSASSVRLGVYGSGWGTFDYRLNDAPWVSAVIPRIPSADTLREALLSLDALPDGEHVLQLRENSDAPIEEVRWTISTNPAGVLLNEIAAINVSEQLANGFPDWVELVNTGDVAIDLGGYRLRDSSDGRHLLPPGTQLNARERLTIPLVPTETSGFALDRDGDSLALIAPDGTVIDEIHFGRQIPHHTLARLPSDANQWGLCYPTPGAVNRQAITTGAPHVRLNEAYAASGIAFDEDFVELLNVSPWPGDLTGTALTDDPLTDPDQFIFPPYTFIAPNEFVVIRSSELGFGLDAWFESISLIGAAGGEILDRVYWQGQGRHSTIARIPNGDGSWEVVSPGTPGRANESLVSAPTETPLVTWESNWQFYQNEEPPGNGWTTLNYPTFSWGSGNGAFFRENAALAVSKNTSLALNPPHTHAFRQIFSVDDPTAFEALALSLLIDDGAVIYLNGEIVWRQRMPEVTPVPFDTFANDGVSNASIEGPFLLDASALHPGANILAVSVHQDDNSSSDVVFAAELTGIVPDPMAPVLRRKQALLQDLRITEIMFHPNEGESEWLEIMNVGSDVLDLEGLRFSQGLTFDFPPFLLEPNERAVIVSSEEAFRRQYPDDIRLVGVFQGRLDNAGESLAIQLPFPDEHQLLAFDFQPDWYPATDGEGRSLVTRHEARKNSDDPGDWRAGDRVGGTPGASERPVIISQSHVTTILGDDLAFNIEATNTPTLYGASGLPEGLSIDEATGLISGSPQEFGQFNVLLSATNASGTEEVPWQLSVAASGPLASIEWDVFPETAGLDAPFSVSLKALDAEGRLVQDLAGFISLSATVNRGAGPAVVISEIRDSGTDGLTVTKTNPEIDTRGWRLLLNASADRTIHAIHGVDEVEGSVVTLPETFTKLDLPENQLGFNLLWSDDPPEDRQGGQRGWALIVDSDQQAVDFVVWGYSSEELAQLVPVDERGREIEGLLWKGLSVPHPGDLNLTLTRKGPVDSDTSQDWVWMDDSDVPTLTEPVVRQEAFPFEIATASGFVDGFWQGTIQPGTFGSEIHFRATEIQSGLATNNALLNVLPPAPPSALPESLTLQVVVNQPVAVPDLTVTLTEFLEIDSAFAGKAKLIRQDDRVVLRAHGTGEFSFPVLARNALGESETMLFVTVLPDSDGDAMPDAWEIRHGLGILRFEDAALDLDGDGFSNVAEYVMGTDPADPRSRIDLNGVTRIDDDVIEISWNALPGGVYTVEEGRTITDGLVWETVHPGWIVSDGEDGTASFRHFLVDDSSPHLLRVRAWHNGREPSGD